MCKKCAPLICSVVFLRVAAVMGHPSRCRLLCEKVVMLRDVTDNQDYDSIY